MDLDFTGHDTITYSYEVDEGVATVTFKDEAGTSTIGAIIINENRLRSFLEAVGTVAKEKYNDLRPGRISHRTDFSIQAGTGKIVFG